jgi:hypothetical protein
MVATVIQGDPPTRHLHHLCVVDGHLAMNTGYTVSDTEPYIDWHFIVAQHIKYDDSMEPFIGQKVWFGAGDGSYRGLVRGVGRYNDSTVDLSKAVRVDIREPVKRPRNGKEYGWVWGGSYIQWRKESFPKCPACKHWHDPSFIECEQCGYCHKEGAKCKTGY